MSELEYLKGQLADTENAICREEKKAAFKANAETLHDLYTAYIDAGFSKEQAWDLMGAFVAKVLG